MENEIENEMLGLAENGPFVGRIPQDVDCIIWVEFVKVIVGRGGIALEDAPKYADNMLKAYRNRFPEET